MTPFQRSRLSISVIFALNGAIVSTWVSRIPAAQGALGIPPGILGLVLLSAAAGSLTAMPATGWLIARRGSRPLVRLSTFLFAFAPVPLAVARTPLELALALFFFGATSGAQDVAMNVHAVALEEEHDYPMMGSFHAFWSLGAMIGSALGSLAAGAELSMLGHFSVAGTGFAILALLASAGVHRPHQPAAAPKLSFSIPGPVAGLGVIAGIVAIAEGSIADWSGIYLKSEIGANAGVSALGFTAYSAAMIVTRLLTDRLTAAWGRAAVVRCGSLLAAAGLSLTLATDSWVVAMAGFSVVGLGVAGIIPNVFGAAGRIRSLAPGVGMAAVTTLAFTGFLGGPAIIGGIAQALGLRAGLSVVVVCLIAVAAASSWVRTDD